MKAFDTAYAGSMVERSDGSYVERGDPASLAAALLESIAKRDRTIENLRDALDAVLQITQEEHHIRGADSKLYEAGTIARLALRDSR